MRIVVSYAKTEKAQKYKDTLKGIGGGEVELLDACSRDTPPVDGWKSLVDGADALLLTGGADVENRLMALKAEMGLIAPPKAEEKSKQLGSGNAGVHDADVEDVPEAEAASIPEAQLLSEFDKLEEKQR